MPCYKAHTKVMSFLNYWTQITISISIIKSALFLFNSQIMKQDITAAYAVDRNADYAARRFQHRLDA